MVREEGLVYFLTQHTLDFECQVKRPSRYFVLFVAGHEMEFEPLSTFFWLTAVPARLATEMYLKNTIHHRQKINL